MGNSNEYLRLAYDLFHEACGLQMEGELEAAVELYRRSLEAFPTAEAHTFLGWTYSLQGKPDAAIEECKKAIQIDPDFGNPYNDIGACLIEKSRYREAIPWASPCCRRQALRHPPFRHYNLARAYIALEQFNKAKEEFEHALRISPQCEMAREALGALKQRIH
jgi:tetratricopeptide (TPR) repeat protein